jgi:hypothetical protein
MPTDVRRSGRARKPTEKVAAAAAGANQPATSAVAALPAPAAARALSPPLCPTQPPAAPAVAVLPAAGPPKSPPAEAEQQPGDIGVHFYWIPQAVVGIFSKTVTVCGGKVHKTFNDRVTHVVTKQDKLHNWKQDTAGALYTYFSFSKALCQHTAAPPRHHLCHICLVG